MAKCRLWQLVEKRALLEPVFNAAVEKLACAVHNLLKCWQPYGEGIRKKILAEG
jgi:hypothetical protein